MEAAMDNSKASDQQEPAVVAETTQSPCTTPPTKTSATPVRAARKPAIKRRSGSERLLGVDDPKPEPTERPVRRRPSPRPATQPEPELDLAPVFVETPIYNALCDEFASGAK